MRQRVIPVLLLDRHRRVVKTVGFGDRTYIGDPFNIVRIFNDKEVDEICILDIDASLDGRAPDYNFLSELAGECFMPLAYGGGISSLSQCQRLNRLGVEKFVLGSRASDLSLVKELCRTFGSQAIVACVDVRRTKNDFECFVGSGRTALGVSPMEYIQSLEHAGVGEIIIQSIDRDGLRGGYDLQLIATISRKASVPVIALGGAGNLKDLAAGLLAGASAVASGSAFSFLGRLRAVLITYPTYEEVEGLLGKYGEVA